MKIGGWSRLGIVISILYGMAIIGFSFDDRPQLKRIHEEWFGKAYIILPGDAVLNKDDYMHIPIDLLDGFWKDVPTAPDLNSQRYYFDLAKDKVEWLTNFEKTTDISLNQYAGDIAKINEKYKGKIDNLLYEKLEYWSTRLSWWMIGTLFLFGSGGAIGWVYRGFRPPKKQS